MAETATLELPTLQGPGGLGVHRAGRLHARRVGARAPPAGTDFDAAHLLEPPAGAIELVQVDGASTRGRGSRRRPGRAAAVGRARAPSRAGRAAPRHDRRATSTRSPRSTSREWEGGAFVYVPAGVIVDAPILLTAVDRGGRHDPQPARADRARGGRRGRGLGAVPLRRRRRHRAQHGRRAPGGPEREAALRLRAGAQRALLDLRRAARRGGARRRAGLGRARLRLGQGQGAHGDAAGRPGRRRQGHRRVRAARAPARRLRHHAGARRAEHDVRPRVPRHPRRPLHRRSGAA